MLPVKTDSKSKLVSGSRKQVPCVGTLAEPGYFYHGPEQLTEGVEQNYRYELPAVSYLGQDPG